MNIFLKLKHWQLFILTFGIPVIFEIIFMREAISGNNPWMFFKYFPVMMIIYVGIIFGWFYALGTNLQKKLPETVKMNLTRFRWFFFIPVAYILFFCWVIFNIPGNENFMLQFNPLIFLAIFPVHLFCMFCIFYCLYFVSKSLKSVELQRPVTFSDFAGEFFLIWFLPIGVWIIQPRINKLFNTNQEISF